MAVNIEEDPFEELALALENLSSDEDKINEVNQRTIDSNIVIYR